jgi:hypothetical protein
MAHRAAGPAREEHLLPRRSWPVFRRSSTKRLAVHRETQIRPCMSSRPMNTAVGAAVPATLRMAQTLAAAAFSMTLLRAMRPWIAEAE